MGTALEPGIETIIRFDTVSLPHPNGHSRKFFEYSPKEREALQQIFNAELDRVRAHDSAYKGNGKTRQGIRSSIAEEFGLSPRTLETIMNKEQVGNTTTKYTVLKREKTQLLQMP